MARIRIAASNAASIPTPPANKATMFLDQSDMSFKAKLPDGSLIPISATEEYIQDQFANFIQDSSTINFTYDDTGDTAYLEVIQSALDIFQIPVTPTGNLTSNNVGDALNELQSSIDTTDQNFADHTDGGPSKHDATEIDYERADGSRNSIQVNSDNVEAALSDLDDNKLARNGSQAMTGNLNMAANNIVTSGLVDGRDVSVDGAKLDTVEPNAKDDQLASEVPVTPTGNLASNNVQSALQELQGDIDTINSTFVERAQDAVGNILQDTSTVEFTYDDAGNQISAIVPAAGITDQEVAPGINAQKIGDGSVDNAEYQRLNGVTAPIQTQIDSKVAKAGDTMTGPLVLSADPLTDFQAATKRYVDNAIQGLAAKDAVKAATTVAGTLASSFENGDVIDGVILVTGDRILIKNQTNLAENGIYTVNASGAPTRSTDADLYSELVSAFVFVEQGATQANTGWTSQAVSGGTINVDPVPWVQFSSAGVVTTDGQGIERVGNELRLELDGPTLTKSGSGLKVADAQIGTTQLTDQGVTNGKVADGTLTDQKINAAAGIQHSKMAALTANRALQSNASGVVSPSVVTSTEQNQLQGVTSNIQTQLDNKTPISHLDGAASKHDATEIDYERADVSKTSIQASSDDVESALSDLDDNKLARSGTQAMTGNLNMGGNNVTNVNLVDGRDVSVDGAKLDGIEAGATADQNASEVPVTPVGNISSTDVQSALAELDSEKVPTTRQVNAGTGLTGGGDLSANRTINMPNVGTPNTYGSATQVPVVTTDAQGRVSGVVNTPINGVPGANITNTPAGNIAATNVQAALNELDSEKQAISQKGVANGYASLDSGGKVPVSQLPDTVVGSVDYKGTWNANTNSPNLGALTPDKGDYYVVNVAGATSLGGITDWQIGDWAIYNGTVWEKVDNTDQVMSVFGRMGAVTAQSGDYNASQITNTPAGTIAATNVQAALNELDAEKVPTTRNISAGAGLSGGGDLSADRSISMPNVGTPNTYGSATQVPQITTDAQGRVSSVTNTPINGVPGANITNTPAGNISATNVQAAINELDAEKQPLDGDLTAVAALAGTGLVTRTAANTMTTRTITAVSGETTVSNGDGVSGNPAIGLSDVGAGAGSVGAANSTLSITTDAKGRVTARAASLISIVSSQVTDFAATVRSTVLTGLVAGTNTAILATDTLLTALQNLQAQITNLISVKADKSTTISAGYGLTGGGDLSANRTFAVSLTDDEVSATNTITTTSATNTLMTGMAITPAAGTYLVLFSASLSGANDDANITSSIYAGGTLQTGSERQVVANVSGGFANPNTTTMSATSFTVVTVNGSQAIEGRWRRSAGTATATFRHLKIIRIG